MAVPESLLSSLEGVPGFNRESFEEVHRSGRQVVSVRLNPQKADAADCADCMPVPWCPHGKYLSQRPSFTLDPLFHAGAYYVQEASSMFLWQAISQHFDAGASLKVLDLCAAPGGKSTLLASYFTNGLVVANEIIKQRAAVLVENCTKWGSTGMVVTNNDPSHFASLPGFFDMMVVDAPCSGSGLFRKDPTAVQEWSEDNVALCSQRQQRILADALPALKEEGILVYSTCSYSTTEDEMICDWLVNEMQMEGVALRTQPGWNIVETYSPRAKSPGYRFYPDQLDGEGFFIAVFRKITGSGNDRWKEQALTLPSRQEVELLQGFVQVPESLSLFKPADEIRAIPAAWMMALKQLAKHLYIRKAGTAIGSVKGRDIIPSHEMAMSGLWRNQFEPVQLDRVIALDYLRRKDISGDGMQRGWNLVAYEKLPLGWVKVLPNRVNNYYPAEWRILKE